MIPKVLSNDTQLFQHLKRFSLRKSHTASFLEEDVHGKTDIRAVRIDEQSIHMFINEFWTAKQRQASSLHEVSYRACFKPQLPRFFIQRMSNPGDTIYDPFSGRGTTAVEAALLGRHVVANDVNPLSRVLARPRLMPPQLSEVADRLRHIELNGKRRADIDLSMFYHIDTERELVALRKHFLRDESDHVDDWIRMVATNRLTGHSPGFFSVYTLPPNQAVSPARQIKINEKRQQVPPYRDTRALIYKKSRQLLSKLDARDVKALTAAGRHAVFHTAEADATSAIPDESIQLTVTSPPFLNVVQYASDNWLRCWFNGFDAEEIDKKITTTSTLTTWTEVMSGVFRELFRVTRRGGWVAFEVGEVRKGKIKLEQHVVPIGCEAGFHCTGILINEQEFTKTANIWGVSNNQVGTNSNRIVMFRKE